MIQKYCIRCVGGNEIVEDLSLLSCPHGHDSLLRTEYSSRKLHISSFKGMYRFLDWLPVSRPLLPSGGPVTFGSTGLSRELGLPNLFVSFSGYCPEIGADLVTGSFKELEASPTMQRLQELGGKIPIIASAGNTGRAFAGLSARCQRPAVIVVPEKAVPWLWTTEPAQDIFLVAVKGDYSDSIAVSTALAAVRGCVPEGGARNVARRDGMGTVMLDAAVTMNRLPDHYFQAVGSGTGGIAAWEAAMRLTGDGRFGSRLPVLHLAQNAPFTPIVSAWQERRRQIIPEKDMPDAPGAIAQVMSDVLTNRNPPYGIRGGLFDALMDTGGRMYAVSNTAAIGGMKLIRETTGIDPDPAAAVAAASLVQAVEKDIIGPDDHILLNLTGGGYDRVREDFSLHPVPVSVTVSPDGSQEETVRMLTEWIRHHG
jgi:cysteate synthase